MYIFLIYLNHVGTLNTFSMSLIPEYQVIFIITINSMLYGSQLFSKTIKLLYIPPYIELWFLRRNQYPNKTYD